MRVKHLCGALALLIIVDSFHGARCQNQPKLALDSTKPFVYVKFDHSGPRSPQRSDEPSQGLWLRLVNNSVLPIFMRVHSSIDDPEMTILEDVVTPQIRRIPKTGFVDYGPMPHGYATAADVTSVLTLKPGENVLFSVPVNHVAPGWFLQVAFQFDVPPVEHGAAQPVCYAEFDWDDIPEKSRWAPSQHSSWHKVDAGPFSILAPSGWEFHQLEGVDSYVGEFVGDGVVLAFDFGGYSNPLKEEKKPTYVVIHKSIDGHAAKIVSPRVPSHGITGVYFRNTGNASALTLFGKDFTPTQQELALKIFETLRFGGPPPRYVVPPPPPTKNVQ